MTATTVTTTELRARFAARLSVLYGTEVPAYTTLVEVSQEVNRRAVERSGQDATRLGSIERVTAERHGAIRVGSPAEMAQVARVFAALGMHPCGFYDLRDAHPRPIPVVSTAFRPLDRDELAINPFRVFTSMLVPEDRRFFDADLEERLRAFIGARSLFSPALLELADRASAEGGLDEADAARFLDLAAESFSLTSEPIDRAWYQELARISDVAADIGGVGSTHINHLTPRVLDIDDLYTSMQARGITMIDAIQGPPAWEGPDVLLRQTSFRALDEQRTFREADGSITQGTLRVRFGEVEARGIALTTTGRELYEQMVAEVGTRSAGLEGEARAAVAPQVWREHLPVTEHELFRSGLGFFTAHDTGLEHLDDAQRRAVESGDLWTLVDTGVVETAPIVYEDFLPRSAAGIFASNLTGAGSVDESVDGQDRDVDWLSDVVGTQIAAPEAVYAAESQRSLDQVGAQLADRFGARFAPLG
ncbi:VOC family protein [Nocardioides sp. GY 10127]|uniref:2-oxoadipate dioxygenase/decarboxylase n=1 Tax=Nocardioides sp. GY 10127 TaxID=2569762 RepID=UPI0010A90A3A|nr:VOC family protein [Nocardioides sp. GY 10127]TIC81703.1 VOC family protein [Nocardioides sp. GY 10127]